MEHHNFLLKIVIKIKYILLYTQLETFSLLPNNIKNNIDQQKMISCFDVSIFYCKHKLVNYTSVKNKNRFDGNLTLV